MHEYGTNIVKNTLRCVQHAETEVDFLAMGLRFLHSYRLGTFMQTQLRNSSENQPLIYVYVTRTQERNITIHC